MLANNFIKALKKLEFENYQINLKMTLIKNDIIAEVED